MAGVTLGNHPIVVGTTLGNYQIEEELGAGGMGVVYRATDRQLGRPVAVKTLVLGGTMQREFLARFLREARAESQLQHPCVVVIHQLSMESDPPYIVMEYVEGKTLKQIIGGQALPVNQLCEIGIQVADGLAAAHEHNIIHRDIKSQNVMLTPRGQAKILDFGLAKIKETAAYPPPPTPERTMFYGEDDPESAGEAATVRDFHTTAGTIMGTASNMSPEQALGGDVDVRSDVFSFGVMLYEMATGRMPFDAGNPTATLRAILQTEPTPVAQVRPELPPDLARLIHQCLAKQRDFRPNAAEVREDLKKIQASLSANKLVDPGVRVVLQQAAAPILSASREAAWIPSPAVASAPPIVPKARRQLYWLFKAARIAVSWAMITWSLTFVFYFLILGGVIQSKRLEDTAVMTFLQAAVVPLVNWARSIVSLQLAYRTWDFLVLGLALVPFVVRLLLVTPLQYAEHWANPKSTRRRE